MAGEEDARHAQAESDMNTVSLMMTANLETLVEHIRALPVPVTVTIRDWGCFVFQTKPELMHFALGLTLAWEAFSTKHKYPRVARIAKVMSDLIAPQMLPGPHVVTLVEWRPNPFSGAPERSLKSFGPFPSFGHAVVWAHDALHNKEYAVSALGPPEPIAPTTPGPCEQEMGPRQCREAAHFREGLA